jgi:hypothetical protein
MKEKSIFDVLRISKEERSVDIDIDLRSQTDSLKALLNRLSDDLGIFEEAEVKARAAKLEVAAKFAAVEKLLKYTESVQDMLENKKPEPVEQEVQVAKPRSTIVIRPHGRVEPIYNPEEILKQAVILLGGEACVTDIQRKIAEIANIGYSAATNLYYKCKNGVLVGRQEGNRIMYRLCEQSTTSV